MKAAKKKQQTKKGNKKAIAKFKKSVKRKRYVKVVKEQLVEYKAHSDKIVDESWDFRKANTKEFTHCFHPYPAMMIPQVARRIIENFGNNSNFFLIPITEQKSLKIII